MIWSFKQQLKYEYRAGIKVRWKQYMGLVLVFFLLGACIYHSAGEKVAGNLTLTDYLVKIFSGIDEMKKADRTMAFYLPKEWGVVEILYLLFVVNYPKSDYEQRGYQVILRTKSKSMWWIGKCSWLVMTTICYYGIFYLVMLVCSMFRYQDMTVRNVWGIQQIILSHGEGILSIYLMPWITMLAIAFVMILLSMTFNQIVAVSAAICYLISAVYISKSWLLGNYTMLLRNQQILGSDGVTCRQGILFSLGIIIITTLVGMKYMKNKKL
ncbi:MAG: hypothetical protein PHD56_00705 [Anaerostipes sp.]|nr:hypothetical protein [Anaerostipes sp.]